MTKLPAGAKLGRFEIQSVLGQGAMGVVYLAHDPQIDRAVALKTLRADLISGDHTEIEARFLKEARLAGRLSHPNIVTIYEAGEDAGVAYIAMERVEGEALTALLGPESRLSLANRVSIVRQVALALGHAHERGVLHRDIKPGNILVTPDLHVKVADFGIGKLLTAASGDLTRTGHLIGSPAYMSPEQIRGEKPDGRSDLFSLGVVFYELLAGARPFPGDSITTLVYQILHTDPRDPRLLRADLPAATGEVFARLLAKAPENRPANAAEFLEEVDRIEMRASRTIALAAPVVADVSPTESTPGATTIVSRSERAPAHGYLFGAAAVILAAAALIWILRSTARSKESVAPIPAAPTVSVPAAEQPTGFPTAAATAPPLPTSGPQQAADAIVGAPRLSEGAATPIPRLRRTLTALAATPLAPSPAPVVAREERSEPARETAPVDNAYRTRRYAKFAVSPDQARIFLDGRYVGIADDWDDRGGGKTLEIGKEGLHRVRLELPGYRIVHLEVRVTPNADDETVDIGDELKRESKTAYPKIPKLDERTVGPVVFVKVDPPDTVVSEGGRQLGSAAAFTESSPLRLSGPTVHDLVLSAPGRKSKTVRVLVANNADSTEAKVKAELKKE